jgi:hypothetical protein
MAAAKPPKPLPITTASGFAWAPERVPEEDVVGLGAGLLKVSIHMDVNLS